VACIVNKRLVSYGGDGNHSLDQDILARIVPFGINRIKQEWQYRYGFAGGCMEEGLTNQENLEILK
jgi:hypothetical protein